MSFSPMKKLVWKDKRPIGIIHLASYAHRSEINPSGWCFDPSLNVFDRNLFREKMRWWVQRSLPILKEINAQGVCLWEPDGFRYGEGYFGSPDLALALNPELEDGILNEIFRTYRENKLTVGCTLRAAEFDFSTKTLKAPHDYYRNLLLKASYAHEVWGCKIFYVDSPFEFGTVQLLSSDIFASLHRKLPDCLFVPEWGEWENQKRVEYSLWTSIYRELRNGYEGTLTPRDILHEVPSAFACVNCAASLETLKENIENLKSRRNIDIFWIDAFWKNELIETFKEIYK